jgi:hypothetical protein
MASFGKTSRDRLDTCHPDIQLLFEAVVKYRDCSILCGTRTESEQNAAYDKGASTKKWPDSKHNTLPSIAVDVAPYPIDWDDTGRFHIFGGYVMAVAESMGIKIRWGGDWDGDGYTKDQTFNDLVHFELV